MKPEFIIVHHSASSRDKTILEQIDAWHKARAFPKSKLGYYVGYHYLIFADGLVKQTRNDDEVGAHAITNGMNFKSIGVCLTGNFEEEEPTEKQIISLELLLKQKTGEYNIVKDKIIGHSEIPCPTACCGKNLFKWLIRFRSPENNVKKQMLALLQELVNLVKQI